MALEYVCLDYMASMGLKARMQSVGPVAVGESLISFRSRETLVDLVKAFGVEKLLYAIGDAAPNLSIVVSEVDEFESGNEVVRLHR